VKLPKVILLSLVIVAVCYANSLPNEFVLDDVPIVGANTAIRTIQPIHFLISPYASAQFAGIYRPFTTFSLSLDYSRWQNWPPGYRLTNLLVHSINGSLVFLLTTSIIGGMAAPLAAMTFYLAHPAHTEAVTTIVGRSELFAACFFLAAWLLFRRGRNFGAAAFFLLSLLSKENAIVLPAVLLVDMWLGQSGNIKEVLAAWKRFVVLALTAALYLIIRLSVLGAVGIPAQAQYMGGKLSFVERWMTSGRVFLEYLRLILAPVNVAGDYDFNAIPVAGFTNWDAWLGILIVIGLAGAAFSCRRSNRTVALGLFFFLIALVPVSNAIMPIGVLMAERFLYLPLVGVAFVIGQGFSAITAQSIRRLLAFGYVSIAVILCIAHDYVWRNDFTFYQNMVRVVPASAKGRLGYGFTLLESGRKDDAERELLAGLRILPDSPPLLSTLALARMTRTHCDQARPLLERALAIDPKHGNSLRRMADCEFREGRPERAEGLYRRAVENIPYPDSVLFVMWGRSLQDTGRLHEAVTAFKRAAVLDPRNVFIKQRLASLSH
jgi:protein O-mannosyl-transferase